MNDKIWLVTSGEYSDYRVVAAFEGEDDARSAVDSGVGDGVTSIYLFGADRPPVRRRVYTANATINADGSRLHEPRCWGGGAENSWLPEDALQRPEVSVEREPGRIYVSVDALDADQALKACRDREAQIRAEILTEPAAM